MESYYATGKLNSEQTIREMLRQSVTFRSVNEFPTLKEFKFGGDYFIPTTNYLTERNFVTLNYTFALPCREAIALLLEYSPILEVGCGTGLWSRWIQNVGGYVHATDKTPKKNQYGQKIGEFIEVNILSAHQAVKEHPSLNVLMVWPPYSDGMADRVARTMTSGNHLIYIGEWGGSSGDDSFFRTLDDKFTEVETLAIPQWWGIHDFLFVLRKK